MQNPQGCFGFPKKGNLSEVYVDTYNTVGTTNGSVIRFSNVRRNQGSDIAYQDDAAYGASFTVSSYGFYQVSVGAVGGASTTYCGISINTTLGNSSIGSITYAQGFRAVSSSIATGAYGSCSWGGWLYPGDVVRWHGNGVGPGTGNQTYLSMSRVA